MFPLFPWSQVLAPQSPAAAQHSDIQFQLLVKVLRTTGAAWGDHALVTYMALTLAVVSSKLALSLSCSRVSCLIEDRRGWKFQLNVGSMTSIVLQIATASKPDKFLQVRHKPLKYLAADSSQGQQQPAVPLLILSLWFRRQNPGHWSCQRLFKHLSICILGQCRSGAFMITGWMSVLEGWVYCV